MTRLILLDRDGVINYDSPDYVKDVHEWTPIPGSLDAIARLKQAGCLVAVCSNQSGVGRGILSEQALERIHARMRSELADRGARLDALYYCPHRPEDGCRCRKPRPGMLQDAMQSLGVPPAETVFVGDRLTDVEAAVSAGCRPVLVRGRPPDGRLEEHAGALGAERVAEDLAAFVDTLLEQEPC